MPRARGFFVVFAKKNIEKKVRFAIRFGNFFHKLPTPFMIFYGQKRINS